MRGAGRGGSPVSLALSPPPHGCSCLLSAPLSLATSLPHAFGEQCYRLWLAAGPASFQQGPDPLLPSRLTVCNPGGQGLHTYMCVCVCGQAWACVWLTPDPVPLSAAKAGLSPAHQDK